jgi:hypothetical protein
MREVGAGGGEEEEEEEEEAGKEVGGGGGIWGRGRTGRLCIGGVAKMRVMPQSYHHRS